MKCFRCDKWPCECRDGLTLIHGDCREAAPALGFLCDTILTDPPYGLSFMGKDWDHGIPGESFWRILSASAKPGAMVLAFGGTRTFHRLTCAMEDASLEIRDVVCWLYGSGFPKSLDVSKAIDKAAGSERENAGLNPYANRGTAQSKQSVNLSGSPEREKFITAPSTDAAKLWNGWGTALKPAWEPIVVAMKPLDGTFADNALRHGVAGLNVDGARIPADAPIQSAAGSTGFGEERDDGYSGEGRQYDNTAGRWPANVAHDGSGEVLAGFPEAGGGFGRNGDGSNTIRREMDFGMKATGEVVGYGDAGSAARFFYCAKASKDERGDVPPRDLPLFGEHDPGFKNNHPTVKPIALMEWLATLTATPTGGIVLDPFCGSGSTLLACRKTGRRAVGIDNDLKSIEIAAARLEYETVLK